MGSSGRLLLLLVCFLLSGVAALIYQTAWARQFAFVFGTSELAVASVLASYMGGLSVGAAVAARVAPRIRRPVLAYAALELGIALAALFWVPAAIEAAQGLYVGLLGAREALPGDAAGLVAPLFYLACSFVIVLVPTGLMGATLPLLARHAVQRESQIGSRVGALYAINTVGAVAGTLLAGFLLLPRFGLAPTIQVAAALNALVFLAAALAARGTPAPAADVARGLRPALAGRAWILPLMLVSGAVSFSYEVLWTRLLAHLLGGSIAGFATMLASFLTGIALGSAVAARVASSARRAALGFALVQLGTAALSLAAFAALDLLPALSGSLAAGGSRLVAGAVSAALTLLPGALCIGATFPLAVRLLARGPGDAGPASARVYAWNTVGAILGAVVAGFFLIPRLGFEGTVLCAAVTNLVLALVAGGLASGRARGIAWAAAAALALLLVWQPAPPWSLLRSSPLTAAPAPGRVAHFGVGRSATVLLLERDAGWMLRSNGLPESSIQPPGARAAQFAVAHWLGRLPALARPEAESMLVIGLGGGTALENVPPSFRSIEVVELEPEVVEANRAVAARRGRDPLADPRLRVVVNDARNALLLTRQRFDAVVSQPSHPWSAGASHLYTREFFQLVRDRLAPDGVLVQWMGVAFVDAPLLRSLLATLLDVFPYVELYRPAPAGVLFLASASPLELGRSAPRAIAASPAPFTELGLLGAAEVLAHRWLDTAGARALAAGAPLNTDDHNRLLGRGPEAARGSRAGFDPGALFAPHDPLVPPPPGLDVERLVRRLVGSGFPGRARRIAEATVDPARREAALALAKQGARQHWQRALELDPGSAEARFGLVSLERGALLAGEPEVAALASGLDERGSAVVQGWQRLAEDDIAGLADLDLLLAGCDADDPFFADALRLRVAWRLRSGGESRAQQALRLADELAAFTGAPRDLLLRAQAAAAAGYARGAFQGLSEVELKLRNAQPRREGARQALALLGSLPRDAVAAADRAALSVRLQRLAR